MLLAISTWSTFRAYNTCFPIFFFFNDTATTEIYTLSLHDALPICSLLLSPVILSEVRRTPNESKDPTLRGIATILLDRKSTRLNSSHLVISYAVFCLKKKTFSVAQLHGNCRHALIESQQPLPNAPL